MVWEDGGSNSASYPIYNAVAKQEPDNPRWTLRLAQTCFARQWYKDGQQLLVQLLSNSALDPDVKSVVEALAAQYGNGYAESR